MTINEDAVIDKNILTELKSLQLANTPDFFRQLVGIYMRVTPPQIYSLKEALIENDATQVKLIAHSLKSSTASLGALRLSSLFLELENRGRNNKLAGAEELICLAEQEYYNTIEVLNAEVKK